MSRLLKLCMIASLFILATGCVRADMGMTLHDDGSGTYEEQVIVSETGLAEAGITEKYFDTVVEELDTTNVKVEDVKTKVDGVSYVGKKISFDFSNFNDLQTKLVRIFRKSQDEPENTNDEVNHIADYITTDESDRHRFRMDMPAETLFSGSVGENKYNYTLDATFYVDLVDDDIEIYASNADNIDGTRHEWNLIDRNSSIQLDIGLPKAGGSTLSAVLGIGILTVLLLGLCLMLSMVNKDTKRIDKEVKSHEQEDTQEKTADEAAAKPKHRVIRRKAAGTESAGSAAAVSAGGIGLGDTADTGGTENSAGTAYAAHQTGAADEYAEPAAAGTAEQQYSAGYTGTDSAAQSAGQQYTGQIYPSAGTAGYTEQQYAGKTAGQSGTAEASERSESAGQSGTAEPAEQQ